MQRTVTTRQAVLVLALTASIMLLLTVNGITAPLAIEVADGMFMLILAVFILTAMVATLASTLRMALDPVAREKARKSADADRKNRY